MQDKNSYIITLIKSLTEQKRKNVLARNLKTSTRRNLIYLLLKHGQHKHDDYTKPDGR